MIQMPVTDTGSSKSNIPLPPQHFEIPIFVATERSAESLMDVVAYQGPRSVALWTAFDLACALLSLPKVSIALLVSFGKDARTEAQLQCYLKCMVLVVVSDWPKPTTISYHSPATALTQGIVLGNLCLSKTVKLLDGRASTSLIPARTSTFCPKTRSRRLAGPFPTRADLLTLVSTCATMRPTP
jgi:hypothetical protein